MRLRNRPGATRYVHVKGDDGNWTLQALRPGKDSKDLTAEEAHHPENLRKVAKGLLRQIGKVPSTPKPKVAVSAGGSGKKTKTKESSGEE